MHCVNIISILSQTKINFSNFPVNHSVVSFMVYAFHQDVSSIWCMLLVNTSCVSYESYLSMNYIDLTSM